MKPLQFEQPIIFQNFQQWIVEDIDCEVEHFLGIFTVKKKSVGDFVILEGKLVYNLSLGTVRDFVEYFVLFEVVVRHMNKTLGMSYLKTLESL